MRRKQPWRAQAHAWTRRCAQMHARVCVCACVRVAAASTTQRRSEEAAPATPHTRKHTETEGEAALAAVGILAARDAGRKKALVTLKEWESNNRRARGARERARTRRGRTRGGEGEGQHTRTHSSSGAVCERAASRERRSARHACHAREGRERDRGTEGDTHGGGVHGSPSLPVQACAPGALTHATATQITRSQSQPTQPHTTAAPCHCRAGATVWRTSKGTENEKRRRPTRKENKQRREGKRAPCTVCPVHLTPAQVRRAFSTAPSPAAVVLLCVAVAPQTACTEHCPSAAFPRQRETHACSPARLRARPRAVAEATPHALQRCRFTRQHLRPLCQTRCSPSSSRDTPCLARRTLTNEEKERPRTCTAQWGREGRGLHAEHHSTAKTHPQKRRRSVRGNTS